MTDQGWSMVGMGSTDESCDELRQLLNCQHYQSNHQQLQILLHLLQLLLSLFISLQLNMSTQKYKIVEGTDTKIITLFVNKHLAHPYSLFHDFSIRDGYSIRLHAKYSLPCLYNFYEVFKHLLERILAVMSW